MRTKKQKEDNAPLRIANKYEINSVPKTQKDFLADLVKMGIDVDNFLLLTHPDVFCNLLLAYLFLDTSGFYIKFDIILAVKLLGLVIKNEVHDSFITGHLTLNLVPIAVFLIGSLFYRDDKKLFKKF